MKLTGLLSQWLQTTFLHSGGLWDIVGGFPEESTPIPHHSPGVHPTRVSLELLSNWGREHPATHVSIFALPPAACPPHSLPSTVFTPLVTHAPPLSGLTLGMNQELWATLPALTGATIRITAPACWLLEYKSQVTDCSSALYSFTLLTILHEDEMDWLPINTH